MNTTSKVSPSAPMIANDAVSPSSPTFQTPQTQTQSAPLAERIAGSRFLSISALVFAALQAVCPAVVAISAVRVLIGLGALAAAGTDLTAGAWHAAWIRIPMMTIAAAGAVVNLFVIWQVRRLRRRPAAQWRVSPATPAKIRSERLQISLAVLTFVCLAAELYVHYFSH